MTGTLKRKRISCIFRFFDY